MSDKQTDLIPTEPLAVEENQGDRLIRLAIERDADIDKLERLIELKNRQDALAAKQSFDDHFAKMQAAFTAVARTKKGYNYKYAPIDVLQKHCGPVISDYGFSYRWTEEKIEGGKRCILHISGYGHTETNHFDIPEIEGTSQMNAIQVAGSMSSYGRRYTFISGFGVIIEDEDDAQTIPVDIAMNYFEEVKLIRESITRQELIDNWKLIITRTDPNDTAGRKLLTIEKDRKKKELGDA